MKPLISIIVPIYKVENYLCKCIKSICNQSYDNLEIILVDDGSPDKCGEICDDFKKYDKRINVIHKENGGLSSARNTGLDLSHGEYISFIDSDDFISPFFIESLYFAISESNSDIASTKWPCSFTNRDEQNVQLLNEFEREYVVLNKSEALKWLLYQNIPNGAQHRLYSKKIFEKIRFPEGYLFEDVATVYKTFIRSERIAFIDCPIYAYRVRADGIVRMQFSESKMISILIGRNLYRDITDFDLSLEKAAAARAFSLVSQVFLQVPKDKKKERESLWNEMKKYRKQICLDSSEYLRKKNKLAAMISYLGIDITYKFGAIYKFIHVRKC